MFKRKIAFLFVLLTTLICVKELSAAHAVTPNVDPFPIGIFWSPSLENTTPTKYQEIKDMNATYVLLSNDINTFSENDTALTQCTTIGLKCVVQDDQLLSRKFTFGQTIGADGKYVSSGQSLGQTFTTPADPDTAIDTVQLYIDKTQWTAGRKLTLSLYNSPSKTKLIGSASITGPVSDNFPVFNIYQWLTPNTTYYMELTSNDPTSIGWVVCSTTDVYGGGTAYEGGVAKSAYDFYFILNYG